MLRRIYFVVFFLSIVLLFPNCKSNVADEPVVPPKDTYLVSYSLVRTVTAADVRSLFSPVQSVYPDVADILPSVTNGVKVYVVTYNTTFGTKKLVASGVVCIPDGGISYPMLSFQNGTNTVYINAPSANVANYNVQLISGFAATGFVVVIPDYLGFGSSKEVFHPYLHKESTVTSILDLFRAVKEMSYKADLNMKLNSDLYLMGYSQGGLSTLQLHQAIETRYSTEFNLKAVGCGAGPYNLSQLTETIVAASTFPQPYYIAYIMKGFKSAAVFTNPYADIFNEPYASRIDGLFDGINSGGAINNQLTTNMVQLFTSEFRTTMNTNAKFQVMRDALVASSVTAWKIKAPLILTHGQADTDVSPLMSSQLYADLIKLDPALPVTYIPLPGMDHSTASAPSLVAFVKRFLVIKGK
ncbi:MAG: lipase family protein [Prolixibacteraceae bacterium]